MEFKYKVGILTVSDRSAKGEREDISGNKLKEIFENQDKFKVTEYKVVPDEIEAISEVIKKWSDELNLNLILTTGGTGFSKRDITPEAVKSILHKEASGLSIALMSESLKITPMAMLSRPICGTRFNTLIVTLPGSPKGATENLNIIIKQLPHALDLLKGDDGEKFHKNMGCRCDRKEEVIAGNNTKNENKGVRVRNSPYPMISIEQAQAQIKSISQSIFENNLIKQEKVRSGKGLLGKIVAKDIYSPLAIPPYKASIVDGYAMCADDFEGVYHVLKEGSSAGDKTILSIQPGQIARISTGAPLPLNANKVVMIEDTKVVEFIDNNEIKVEILKAPKHDDNVRPIGSDVSKDQLILPKYHRIDATNLAVTLGILASCGIYEVDVFKTPKVGILSSGNEVVDISVREIQDGQIRDANRPSLISAIENIGVDVVDLGIIKDDYKTIEDKLINSFEKVDIIITTGGVSMGEKDFIKPILNEHPGFDLKFGRIMMKPGKPATFATYKHNKMIFALPGNPVSAMVTFQLLVLPALKTLSGDKNYKINYFDVELEHSITLDSRPEYQRCVIRFEDGKFKASSNGNQISSRSLSLLNANGLLVLPPKTQELKILEVGQQVKAILIGNLE